MFYILEHKLSDGFCQAFYDYLKGKILQPIEQLFLGLHTPIPTKVKYLLQREYAMAKEFFKDGKFLWDHDL